MAVQGCLYRAGIFVANERRWAVEDSWFVIGALQIEKGRKNYKSKELELAGSSMCSTQYYTFQAGFMCEAALDCFLQIAPKTFHVPVAMVTTLSEVRFGNF